jgi:hypothetical protein
MSVVRHGAGLVVGLTVAVVLLAGCDDDPPDDEPTGPSAAQVLDRLGGQSDALDESDLDDLAAAGGDDSAAETFRSRYLAYVEGSIEQTIRDAGRADWPTTLEQIEQDWVLPAAEVIGALEAGCDQSGGTCSHRLDQAELEFRDAVESATYAAMPADLLPQVFLEGGDRVAMSAWTTAQKDEWQRLRNTTLLPLTSGVVEEATFARMRSAGA